MSSGNFISLNIKPIDMMQNFYDIFSSTNGYELDCFELVKQLFDVIIKSTTATSTFISCTKEK